MALVVAASALFQAWFLGLTPHGHRLGDPRLSDSYTEALAHGQSYLLTTPDPRVVAAKDAFGPATIGLMPLDVSYFRGRYYMYFGIAPFATFMVPWRLISGSAPSPEVTILFFTLIGFLAYGGSLAAIAKKASPNASFAWLLPAYLAFVVSCGVWPLMGRPAIYEIENAAAFAFFGLGLFFLISFKLRALPARPLIFIGTFFVAATLGCRPNYFPAVSVVLAWAMFETWPNPSKSQEGVRPFLFAVLPVVVVGLILACWNHHRFGSVFDFGLAHTISSDPATARPLSTLSNLPYHLHRYTIGLPRLDRYFPFIQGQLEGPVHLLEKQEVSNQVYGFLIVAPVLCFALLPLLRGTRRGSVTRGIIWCLAGAFLGNFLFLCSVTMSCYRYPADFLGPLALLASVGIVGISNQGRSEKLCLSLLAGGSVAFTIAAVFCQTFSTAQTTELFDERKPAEFAEAAKPFNHIEYLLERHSNNPFRQIRLTVRLPQTRFGKSEPLLVTGENGSQDFVYLYYAGPGVLEIGFESMGVGGPLSKPISVDYTRSHLVTIHMGSFLPPNDHPAFKGFTEERIEALRSQLQVELDGSSILQATVHFHAPRAQLFIGQSPFDSAFGSRFTGIIEKSD